MPLGTAVFNNIIEIKMFTHIVVTGYTFQCQDAAAFLQYKIALLPVEQYQKVQKKKKQIAMFSIKSIVSSLQCDRLIDFLQLSRLLNNGYFHECLFVFQCLHNAGISYDAKLIFNAISYIFRYVLKGDGLITVGH